jgi:hypothetical protein
VLFPHPFHADPWYGLLFHEHLKSPEGKNIMGVYFTTLLAMLKAPGHYFRTLAGPSDRESLDGEDRPGNWAEGKTDNQAKWLTVKKSLGFLAVSCVISTMAALATNDPINPLKEGAVYFLNGMGMALVAAGFGFMIMTMFMEKKIPFARFLSIYALAWGTTVLVAWIPWAVWMAEPWKWWLIGTGLTAGLGFKTRHAVALLVSSIVVMMIFFSTMLPAVNYLKAAVAAL